MALFLNCFGALNAFQPTSRYPGRRRSWPYSASPSEVDDDFDAVSQTLLEPTDSTATTATSSGGMILDCALPDENVSLKSQLLRLAASYDRGFGASKEARQQAETIIRSLEQCPNASSNSASTILIDNNNNNNNNHASPSLLGTWRLIWTTALDVLSLQASPFFTAGAIHQVFERSSDSNHAVQQQGVVTNVIDFEPRVELLFPGSRKSMIRALVTTRACEPAVRHPNRVGLVFETVTLQPQKLWGLDTSSSLPPLQLNLPRLPESFVTATGYFDVIYLDAELLIIQQNAPGGLFALLRVDSLNDP